MSLTKASYSMIAGAPINVLDFGATGDGTTDDTIAIQDALTYANSLSAGATVYLPLGTYKCTAQLNIYPKTILQGAGKTTSILTFNHTGVGIKSTSPLNSSTAVYISLRDLKITNTNVSNVNGGYVDVGGSFITIDNIVVEGFKYGIIFDQTEVSSITNCAITPTIANGAGIWLANGNYTGGANIGFTNRITITANQFNSVSTALANILDDGGANHSIRDNNFNASQKGIRAAGVSSLVVSGNESEGHIDEDIYLADTTSNNVYVGPCQAPQISGNTLISGSGGANIRVENCDNGSIVNNFFGQAAAAITFVNGAANYSRGIIIEGNTKLILFVAPAVLPGTYISGFASTIANQIIRQTPASYSTTGLSAGTVTVTPAQMEFIYPGTQLVVQNNDGTNFEIVTVTSTTATTFTATFASNKAANFLLYGQNPSNQIQGTWTPTLYGFTTAGTNTYTTQTGRYYKQGNLVTLQATVVISAVDASMSGALLVGNLPYIPNSTFFTGSVLFSGFTLAAGYSQIICSSSANTNGISLAKCGSAVTLDNVYKTDIAGATCSIYLSIQYTTD
jgi:hypothetical protein